MSPRADSYLSLCLEQAAKSPLHYRHGCIIVRGGKVIGQGYNDYRPGFDGGALKTGRLTAGSQTGSVAELKQKQKYARDLEAKSKSTSKPSAETKTFRPFEATGGGSHANTPLSMHSEMMAVHSAISSSSTLASTTVFSQKPCFKLPRDSKRKARLRREALETYVETVFKSGILKPLHLNQAKQDTEEDKNNVEKNDDVAASKSNGGEKHRMENQYAGHHQKMYQYGRSGQHMGQHERHVHSPIRASIYPNSSNAAVAAGAANRDAAGNENRLTRERTRDSSSFVSTTPSKNGHVGTQTVLLPKGRTGQNTRSVTERMKHPRLRGADLYVARLGWRRNDGGVKHRTGCEGHSAIVAPTITDYSSSSEALSSSDDLSCPLTESHSSLSDNSGPSSIRSVRHGERSLHDELTCLSSPDPPISTSPPAPSLDPSAAHGSRPCYRCISYMHSVGIKRAFWTNDKGEWEGGKVRDMVDALESAGAGRNGTGKQTKGTGSAMAEGETGVAAELGVFVTKHEVLMLRRLMGSKRNG